MMTSSLYWALEDQCIEFNEARIKAQQMAWIFGLGSKRIISFNQQDHLQQKLHEYHGTGTSYESTPLKPTKATRYVRNLLDNKGIEVPERLMYWINNPLGLLDDFGIDSTLRYGINYRELNMEDHVQLIDSN